MSSALLRPVRLAAQRLRPTTCISSPAPAIPTTSSCLRHPPIRSASFRSFRQWYQSMWQPRETLAPYQHVTQIGDPVLRRVADPVPADDINSPEIRFLVDRLIQVMRSHRCVGLAAPQIGTALQVLVMELTADQLATFSPAEQTGRRMAELPLTVLINPQLHVQNFARTTFVESCASVRGYAAEVPRYEEVTVSGHDCDGRLQTLRLHGWSARIVQHELDHLNGLLYTDVMVPKTLACTSWQAVNAREGRVYIEFGPK